MVGFTALLLSANLTGVWSAQRSYGERDPLRPATWVWVGKPVPDTIRLTLYVQRSPNGQLRAFIRNPEYNLGGFIGNRIVRVQGASVHMTRSGKPEITGRYDASGGTLATTFAPLPGTFVFRRIAQPGTAPYRYRIPVRTVDGWNTASLQSVGIDPGRIAKVINTEINGVKPALRAPYIQGLLIARHGNLVLDEYFNGFTREQPHDVRSAGKSVTTLIVGRAIEDTGALSPQTHVYVALARYAPFVHYDGRKASMTAADLMSMRPGYACDDNDDNSPGNEGTMQSQTAQPDWYKYTLDLPMLSKPGTRALYCSAGINLLGAIVAGAIHRPLASYFADRFARPMQFGRYGMWIMPPPANQAYMAGGDYFRPRDFLKFGELFLEHGRWKQTQIIDDRWLQTISVRRATLEGGGGEYGYGWHLYRYTINGKTIASVNAGGNGGQLLFVFPSLDMTLMITAANYNQYPVWRNYIEKVIPQILKAVKR